MSYPHSGAIHEPSIWLTTNPLTLPPLFDDCSRIAPYARTSPISSRRSLYDQQILDRLPKDIHSTLVDSSTQDKRTESAPSFITNAARTPLSFYFQSLLLPPPFPGVLPITFHAEENIEVGGTHQPGCALYTYFAHFI